MAVTVHLLNSAQIKTTRFLCLNASHILKGFNFSYLQAAQGRAISEDLFESLKEYHQSGRSLGSLDKTISDFYFDSSFKVRTNRHILEFPASRHP